MLREPPYDNGAGRDDGDGDAAPSVSDILRAALAPVAAQIDAAFIYGALARGAPSAHSDIDIMIIGRGIGYADVIPHFIGAAKYLGRAINPGVYSAEEWRRKLAAGNRVMQALMKQPKIFVLGTAEGIPHFE